MKFQFSEDIWEKISLLWNREKTQGDEELDYFDVQVKELMRMLFQVRRASKPVNEQKYDEKQAWLNIESRTRSRSTRRGITRIFKYAAILIVMFGSVSLWIDYRDKDNLSLMTVSIDSILSGTHRAELILANGKRVILDSNMDVREVEVLGMKFVNDDVNGELRYDGSFVAEDSNEISYNTLYIPKGGEYSLQLPDGSRVWLNSETTLRFPVRFLKDKREVYLCGEAYFKVAKNALAPFHVRVERGDVAVLGTSFNVSAYKTDAIWQTTLVDGRVQVVDTDGNVIMKPAEQYTVDKQTGKGVLKVVDTDLYTSWVDGKFYFNAYAFEDIVKKLERWYDFTMYYQDDEIREMRFSGTINKHRPLNDVLNFLEKTTDIHFEISGKNVTVSKVKKG